MNRKAYTSCFSGIFLMHSCSRSVCKSHQINQGWNIKDYMLCISVYLPMYGDGEDGLDVGQHCFELLRIRLEAHFCQYQRLANILDEKHKVRKYHLKLTACFTPLNTHNQLVNYNFCLWGVTVSSCWHKQRILLWYYLHLVDLLQNCNTKVWCDVIVNIYLLVRTLWWGRRCRMLLCLSALCTFCPRCSCRRSQTLSETKKQHRLMWCGWKGKNRITAMKKREDFCTTHQ